MNCSKCGSYMPDDSKFCGNCGMVFNSAPAVRCPHCGAQLSADDAFCYACGKSVTAPVTVPPSPRAAAPAQKKSGTKTVIIILCIVLAVVLVAVAAIFGWNYFKSINGNSSSGGYMSAQDYINSITPSPSPEPTAVPAPVFTFADASSIRGTDTEGGTYSVSSVLSTDPMTKWVPAKSADAGINEWIEIYSYSDQYVRGVNILNGYHKNSTTWGYNNRVRYCTITFSDGTARDFTLPDTMDMITLDFGELVKTRSIKLTITGIYGGSKWNDTAITYLGAY